MRKFFRKLYQQPAERKESRGDSDKQEIHFMPPSYIP
jgi:hypothetical protein